PSMAHSNTSFATAQTLVISNNHAQAIGDLSTTTDSGYFKFTAPLLGLLSRINFRVNADTLSLVAPRLTLYNGSKVQIGVVSTTDPLNNNVCFSVGNLLPGQTYYLKVDSTRGDAFAVGSYQVSADVYTLGLLPPPDPIAHFNI